MKSRRSGPPCRKRKTWPAGFLKDHMYLAQEMRAQAGRLLLKLAPVPAPYSREERKAIRLNVKFKQLKRLTGEAFDHRYRALMAKNHKDTIDFIEWQRPLLPKDSALSSLLTSVLPQIKDHYDVLTSTVVTTL